MFDSFETQQCQANHVCVRAKQTTCMSYKLMHQCLVAEFTANIANFLQIQDLLSNQALEELLQNSCCDFSIENIIYCLDVHHL